MKINLKILKKIFFAWDHVTNNFRQSVLELHQRLDDPTREINKTLDKILSFMNIFHIFNERLNRKENKSEIISKQIVELNNNVQKSEIEIKTELTKQRKC